MNLSLASAFSNCRGPSLVVAGLSARSARLRLAAWLAAWLAGSVPCRLISFRSGSNTVGTLLTCRKKGLLIHCFIEFEISDSTVATVFRQPHLVFGCLFSFWLELLQAKVCLYRNVVRRVVVGTECSWDDEKWEGSLRFRGVRAEQ